MKKIKLPLLLLLFGCGVLRKPKKIEAPELSLQLSVAKQQILDELKADGWVGPESCDGLLWNALAQIGGADIDLTLAEEGGRWFRRPTKDCYEKGESKSSISNDMLTGAFYSLFANGEHGLLESTYQYGKANNWAMGEGVLSRTVLRPNGIYLLTRAIEKIGGVRKPELDSPIVVNPYFPVSKDFERHIQTVGMLLTIELEGEATEQIIERMEENVKAFPGDALFRAACGMFNPAHIPMAANMVLSPTYPAPSYVRGDRKHFLIHKLFTIYIIERSVGE